MQCFKTLPVVNAEYVNFSNSDSVFKDGSDTSVDVVSSASFYCSSRID